MAFEMIDRQQRQPARRREALGRHQADNDAADQAGAGGCRHTVEIVPADARFVHRLGDQPVEMLDMGAGGDFRHNAAKGRMFGDLRENDVGENFAPGVRACAAAHDGGSRLVAACLDAEQGERFRHGFRIPESPAFLSRGEDNRAITGPGGWPPGNVPVGIQP